MRVFCDMVGHRDLAYSIYALFHNRLGCSVSFAGGQPEEWLSNSVACEPMDHELIPSECYVGLEEFNDTTYDVCIATCHHGELGLFRLCQRNSNKGMFVRQIANLAEVPVVAKHAMMAMLHDQLLPDGCNTVHYIPEHPPYFQPMPEGGSKHSRIAHFNWYSNNTNEAKGIIASVSRELPDLSIVGREFMPQEEMAEWMNSSMAYLHIKSAGSCGFTLREALFSGIPVAVNLSWSKAYQTPAYKYLVDGVNCVDLCELRRPIDRTAELLREWVKGENYSERCSEALMKTRELINFEHEAEKVKQWL